MDCSIRIPMDLWLMKSVGENKSPLTENKIGAVFLQAGKIVTVLNDNIDASRSSYDYDCDCASEGQSALVYDLYYKNDVGEHYVRIQHSPIENVVDEMMRINNMPKESRPSRIEAFSQFKCLGIALG